MAGVASRVLYEALRSGRHAGRVDRARGRWVRRPRSPRRPRLLWGMRSVQSEHVEAYDRPTFDLRQSGIDPFKPWLASRRPLTDRLVGCLLAAETDDDALEDPDPLDLRRIPSSYAERAAPPPRFVNPLVRRLPLPLCHTNKKSDACRKSCAATPPGTVKVTTATPAPLPLPSASQSSVFVPVLNKN